MEIHGTSTEHPWMLAVEVHICGSPWTHFHGVFLDLEELGRTSIDSHGQQLSMDVHESSTKFYGKSLHFQLLS